MSSTSSSIRTQVREGKALSRTQLAREAYSIVLENGARPYALHSDILADFFSRFIADQDGLDYSLKSNAKPLAFDLQDEVYTYHYILLREPQTMAEANYLPFVYVMNDGRVFPFVLSNRRIKTIKMLNRIATQAYLLDMIDEISALIGVDLAAHVDRPHRLNTTSTTV